MHHLPRRVCLVLMVILGFVLSIMSAFPASALTQTFSNTTSITIPATGTGAPNGAPANPYPSTIAVSGVAGSIADVNVSLLNFSHTFPSDVDVLLVGPGGQKVILMSDAGGDSDAVNVSLTFDQAAGGIGATVVNGTFSPTNIGMGDLFPAPAPTAPYGASLDLFNGTNPNGTWSLYVVDDATRDIGSFAGGWSLEIRDSSPVITSPATAAGAVGTPFSHTFTATGDPAPIFSYANENLPPGCPALVTPCWVRPLHPAFTRLTCLPATVSHPMLRRP